MAEENQEEEKAPTSNSPEGEAQAAKKKKLILFIIIGLVVVLGGGGASFVLLKGDDPASIEETTEEAESSEEESDESGEGKKDGEGKEGEVAEGVEGKEDEGSNPLSKYGQTYELKPFNLNLGNPLENRYIRLVIALEFKGGANQKVEIVAKEPKIRDIVVSIATKKTMEFLLGPDGKDHLRHELFVTINQSLEQKVEAVYITDMLIE
jgi:flagellar FliL protein